MASKVISRVFSNERGQGCARCGCWTTGRNYGEQLDGVGFTGWRGPYCSSSCYRAQYPAGVER